MEDKCFECGECCKLFLIDLTEDEYKSRDFKTQFDKFDFIEDFNLAKECGANIIEQDSAGSCIYLENGKCSIHQKRPESCKEFFCTSKDKKFKDMIKEINKVKKAWHVYLLECMDGSFYTGVTNDLDARMNAHSVGKGSKYVYRKGFRELLRCKKCKNKSEACKFEYQIKQLPKKEKLAWFDL
jgi:putative endonuclease